MTERVRERVLILGAAGKDFHVFNMVYRDNADVEVVAFTATQIPDIAGRRYPQELSGSLYPQGIEILDEANLSSIIKEKKISGETQVSSITIFLSSFLLIGATIWVLFTLSMLVFSLFGKDPMGVNKDYSGNVAACALPLATSSVVWSAITYFWWVS